MIRVLAEAEAGKKWKQWRQKGVLKGILRHGGHGRWWQVHEGVAGEQQSFHREWHPSVTFTEKCLKRSEAKKSKNVNQKKPEDPREQQEGPGGSSGARRGAGARVLGQQLVCRKWFIFPSP